MKHLAILLCLFSFFTARAQNSLSGKVYEKESGTTLPGATLYIPDLKRSAQTNIEGIYQFTDLPAGKFVMEVHMIGYSAKNMVVEVNGEGHYDVPLEETHVELNEVVITGMSHATELKRSPVATTIVNKNTLVQGSSTNLIDAIAKVPGIAQVSTGSSISKPVIRGLSYNRILTLYDGMRQEGQQWGDEHGIEIDEYGVDRIEILKGPASLMYGSDGLGGVINILSPNPLPEGNIAGSFSSNYQTNNQLFGNSVSLAGNVQGWNWLGRVSKKSARNYRNAYDGIVFNSGSRETSASGYIGLNKKWGFSHLNFSTFSQELGLPEGERDSMGRFTMPVAFTDSTEGEETVSPTDLEFLSIALPSQKIQHHRLYLNNNFLLGSSRLMLNLGYQENRRREFDDVHAPGEPGIYLLLRTLTYDSRFSFKETKSWQASLGINGMLQQNRNLGTEYIIPAYDLADGGVFGYVKHSLKKIDISGGLRFDHRTLQAESLYLNTAEEPTVSTDTAAEQKFPAIHASFNNISGSLGATYNVSDHLLFKSNIAQGYRAPNIAELSANGIHEGTFRYEKGNAALKAESSLQADLGMNVSSQHLSLEISLFDNRIANYIHLQKVTGAGGGDSLPDADEAAPLYCYLQGDANLYGGEFFIDLHPHPLDWLHFQNTFAYVRGQQIAAPDSLSNLPFMPAPALTSELRANLKKQFHFLKNGYVSVEMAHYFAQNDVLKAYQTETPTPAYTLFNVNAGTDLVSASGHTHASLYLTVSNIFDVAFQSHLSRLKYAPENALTGRQGIYNMGRNFSLRLILPFELASR